MKSLFYLGMLGLIVFEILHVFCIMPLPGSQEMDSLTFAYFLHQWRWVFRAGFGLLALVGISAAFRPSPWGVGLALGIAIIVTWMTNFEMAADRMFYPPTHLRLADSIHNTMGLDKLVLGITQNGQAKAYPLQLIGYHHQVCDTVGGQPVLVTYCTVCRTGRAFLPEVNGHAETFRLVGMDHFNAMLEDATTGSWWRQATGEAVAGPLGGAQLPEIPTEQTSLGTWLALHPGSLILQPDTIFKEEYTDLETYDTGRGRGRLTGTDSLSWQRKSWVVGIVANRAAKAFDWNRLRQKRLLHSQVGERSILLVLAADNQSFFAFERPDSTMVFSLKNDTLYADNHAWNLMGLPRSEGDLPLKRIQAYQEFWHSWATFHPHTTRE